MKNGSINPFATGHTPVCGWRFELTDDTLSEETFLQVLLVILKRLLLIVDVNHE